MPIQVAPTIKEVGFSTEREHAHRSKVPLEAKPETANSKETRKSASCSEHRAIQRKVKAVLQQSLGWLRPSLRAAVVNRP